MGIVIVMVYIVIGMVCALFFSSYGAIFQSIAWMIFWPIILAIKVINLASRRITCSIYGHIYSDYNEDYVFVPKKDGCIIRYHCYRCDKVLFAKSERY